MLFAPVCVAERCRGGGSLRSEQVSASVVDDAGGRIHIQQLWLQWVFALLLRVFVLAAA